MIPKERLIQVPAPEVSSTFAKKAAGVKAGGL
jgi:hypothetical protein